MIKNIYERLRLTRFIWADKIALFGFFLLSFLLVCLWSLAFLVVGNLGAMHLWSSFGIRGIGLEILTVGSIWIVMRVADFLAGTCFYVVGPALGAIIAVGFEWIFKGKSTIAGTLGGPPDSSAINEANR